MTSSFSTDQLHQMNSALNKQLQRLGQLDHMSSLSTLKPVNPLKFSMISQSTDVTQAASHFHSTSIQDPLTHHQYSLPLSSIDYQGFSIEDATSKGLKMQRELIKLHSKVLSLEKKMTLIDTRTPPKKKSARKPTRASLDPQDSATIQFTNFTSLSITPRSPKRLFNKATPKNKNHNISLVSQKSPQKGFHERRASLPKQSLPTSKFASPRQEESRIQQRRASLHVKPTKQQEQKQQRVEQQERASQRRASMHVKSTRKEQQQSEQEKTRRKYNVIDNSRIMEGDSMILGKVTEVQSPMRIETLEYRGYQHDVYILNNQMNQLNKEYEQDKQALKLEKKKGKELENEIKKAGKKMETLGKRIEKVQMLGEDYEGLLGSFKRSEEIRNKQRDMIGNLNYEIILLKAEKENLNTEDKSIREKKRKTSVKKRATSQKKIGAKGI